MASFQAKICRKRPEKRENKNYRSVPTRHVIENSKKKEKNSKKIKKYHYGIILSHNRLEKAEKEKK